MEPFGAVPPPLTEQVGLRRSGVPTFAVALTVLSPSELMPVTGQLVLSDSRSQEPLLPPMVCPFAVIDWLVPFPYVKLAEKLRVVTDHADGGLIVSVSVAPAQEVGSL